MGGGRGAHARQGHVEVEGSVDIGVLGSSGKEDAVVEEPPVNEEVEVEMEGAGSASDIHPKSKRYLTSYKLCPISFFCAPPSRPRGTGNVKSSATPTSAARCAQRASNTSAPTSVSRRRTSCGEVAPVTRRGFVGGRASRDARRRAVISVCVWVWASGLPAGSAASASAALSLSVGAARAALSGARSTVYPATPSSSVLSGASAAISGPYSGSRRDDANALRAPGDVSPAR